jgi:hypothetical protein
MLLILVSWLSCSSLRLVLANQLPDDRGTLISGEFLFKLFCYVPELGVLAVLQLSQAVHLLTDVGQPHCLPTGAEGGGGAT